MQSFWLLRGVCLPSSHFFGTSYNIQCFYACKAYQAMQRSMQCHVQLMYTYTDLWIMLMCGSHRLINQAGWNNVVISCLIHISIYLSVCVEFTGCGQVCLRMGAHQTRLERLVASKLASNLYTRRLHHMHCYV